MDATAMTSISTSSNSSSTTTTTTTGGGGGGGGMIPSTTAGTAGSAGGASGGGGGGDTKQVSFSSSSLSSSSSSSPPPHFQIVLEKFYDWFIRWRRGLTERKQLEQEFQTLIIQSNQFTWCNANGQLYTSTNTSTGTTTTNTTSGRNNNTTHNNTIWNMPWKQHSFAVYGSAASWLTLSVDITNVTLLQTSSDHGHHLIVAQVWETYCKESSKDETTTAKQISAWMKKESTTEWLLLHLQETYIQGYEPKIYNNNNNNPPLINNNSNNIMATTTLATTNTTTTTTAMATGKSMDNNHNNSIVGGVGVGDLTNLTASTTTTTVATGIANTDSASSSSLVSSPQKVTPSPPWEDSETKSSIPSNRRHVAANLEPYNAQPLLWNGNHLVGISIAGWDIGTSQGPIGDSLWFQQALEELEPLAQYKLNNISNNNNEDGSLLLSSSMTRRLVLPEMVFPLAHVVLDHRKHKGDLFLSWDAMDCLKEWSKCHQAIPMPEKITSNSGNNNGNNGNGNNGSGASVAYRGVSVLQSSDATLWKRNKESSSSSSSSQLVGTTEFHYDWTYSTPFYGKFYGTRMRTGNTNNNTTTSAGAGGSGAAGAWKTRETSGMPMHLLTDQSIPILYFDHVILLEDDLHDNGLVQYSVKVRVMPTCAYVLSRLFVRVDHVLIRVRDCRLLVHFAAHKLYRDITWRECLWENLQLYQLPSDIRAWRSNNNNNNNNQQGGGGGGGGDDLQETPQFNYMINQIPLAVLPKDIPAHAELFYGLASATSSPSSTPPRQKATNSSAQMRTPTRLPSTASF